MESKTEKVILIPAYQPGDELIALCRELIQKQYQVVVVDDGSGSDFQRVFGSLPDGVTVLRHPSNQGKGKALKTGFGHIHDMIPEAGIIVTADADGQHLPGDIMKVADRVGEQGRTIVIGGRRFEGNVPLHNKMGNVITRWIFSLVTGVKVNDTQTGLRGFSMDLVPELVSLPGDRYEYEMNVLLWASSHHVELIEIGIETVYLEGNTSSHYRVLRDSLLIYSRIIRFFLSSFAAFIVDFTALLLIRSQLGGMEEARALLLSVVGARVLSASFNFMVNRKLVFRSKEKPMWAAAKYFLLALTILVSNYLLMHLFNLTLGMPLVVAKLLVEGILFILSYTIQKKLVFKAVPKFHETEKGVRDVTK